MDQPDLLYSILIPTLSSRRDKLRRLLDVLLPQAEAHGGVEIVGLHNDGERPLAEYRQALLDDARGEYLSFIDDDDLVETDFISAVTAAMETGPDYVAFWNAFYRDGQLSGPPVRTGIHYGSWYDDGEQRIRDVVHVCPVRTEIARKADFRRESEGSEDWSYVSQLRPLLKTEAYIDRVLYHYYWSSTDSVQHHLGVHAYAPRLEVDSPVFRWHEMSTG